MQFGGHRMIWHMASDHAAKVHQWCVRNATVLGELYVRRQKRTTAVIANTGVRTRVTRTPTCSRNLLPNSALYKRQCGAFKPFIINMATGRLPRLPVCKRSRPLLCRTGRAQQFLWTRARFPAPLPCKKMPDFWRIWYRKVNNLLDVYHAQSVGVHVLLVLWGSPRLFARKRCCVPCFGLGWDSLLAEGDWKAVYKQWLFGSRRVR